MPSPHIRALAVRAKLPTVDETTIDAFLAPAAGEVAHALLLFTGDPQQRPEADDVAVVLPELLAAFNGRLRAAVVRRTAEPALQSRFHVQILPSLVVTRGLTPVGVLPKVRDWTDYLASIERCLAPGAPALAPVAATGRRIATAPTGGAP